MLSMCIAARKAAANVNLDDMVADCIKDTNSDEEPSEADDDPALLVRNCLMTLNCNYCNMKFDYNWFSMF